MPRRSTLNRQSSEAQTTRLEGGPYQDATEVERINANGGGRRGGCQRVAEARLGYGLDKGNGNPESHRDGYAPSIWGCVR